MIVVSDTSPLNYLVQIGQVHVLPQLFGKIVVPIAVYEELSHEGAPAELREWLSNAPEWLEVREAPPHQEDSRIDRGEAEAIALARSLNAPALIDDRSWPLVCKRAGNPCNRHHRCDRRSCSNRFA
jgi:predicted nucleic acid-binding protein